MSKIRVLGPRYLVEPLKLLGLEILPVENSFEAEAALASFDSTKDINLILTSDHQKTAEEEIKKLVKQAIGLSTERQEGVEE